MIQNTSDDAIKGIVKNGIPGTGMPSFDMEKDDIEALVLYIRHLGGGGVKTVLPAGNVSHGREVYSANGCANCHRIGDAGSIFGPELTRIGSSRAPEYLRESIVTPSADIAPDYEGVAVTTRDGKLLTGIRINEDTFSVQIRPPNQRFAMFDKSELKSVQALDDSLMPAYRNFPARDLDDLVAYLSSLHRDSSGADITKSNGIH